MGSGAFPRVFRAVVICRGSHITDLALPCKIWNMRWREKASCCLSKLHNRPAASRHMNDVEYRDPIRGKMIGRRIPKLMVAVDQHDRRPIGLPVLVGPQGEPATGLDIAPVDVT